MTLVCISLEKPNQHTYIMVYSDVSVWLKFSLNWIWLAFSLLYFKSYNTCTSFSLWRVFHVSQFGRWKILLLFFNFLYYCFFLPNPQLKLNRGIPTREFPNVFGDKTNQSTKETDKQVICPNNLLRKSFTVSSKIKKGTANGYICIEWVIVQDLYEGFRNLR